MRLRIVRVSINQFVALTHTLRSEDRWTMNGFPASHLYLPGEKILIVPDTEVIAITFPEDEGLTLSAAIHYAMEGQ